MAFTQIDDVPKMARMMIGVAHSLGKRAVLDPNAGRADGEAAIQALRLTIKTYEALIKIGERRALSVILDSIPAPERADYEAAKHHLRILDTLYSPQPN